MQSKHIKTMEQAALEHVAEELRYRRSSQARIDAENDRKTRAEADRKLGHTPLCTFTHCHISCKRAIAKAEGRE